MEQLRQNEPIYMQAVETDSPSRREKPMSSEQLEQLLIRNRKSSTRVNVKKDKLERTAMEKFHSLVSN